MGVFEMVVLIVLIGTVGKVARAHARGRVPAGTEREIQVLRDALRANELRLGQAEDRVAELGEKLVFVEALLAKPAERSGLPPGAP
jgi:hypothetical protein